MSLILGKADAKKKKKSRRNYESVSELAKNHGRLFSRDVQFSVWG
jgi:hypothetical protein